MASKIPDLYSWLTERGLSLVMDTGDPARPEAPLSRKAVNACGNQWITDRLDAAPLCCRYCDDDEGCCEQRLDKLKRRKVLRQWPHEDWWVPE